MSPESSEERVRTALSGERGGRGEERPLEQGYRACLAILQRDNGFGAIALADRAAIASVLRSFRDRLAAHAPPDSGEPADVFTPRQPLFTLEEVADALHAADLNAGQVTRVCVALTRPASALREEGA